MKKIKKIGSVLIIIFVLLITIILFTRGDRAGAVQLAIRHYIENKCPEIPKCVVRIPDLTDFRWDEMYFIKEGDFDRTIVPAQLPQNYSFINPKLVFIADGKLVVFEEIPVDIEYAPDKTVIINTNKRGYAKFTPATANFSVEVKASTDRDHYYYLTPIQ